jgi:hypothetical protein
MTREERREEQEVYREVMAPILAVKRSISKRMREDPQGYHASLRETAAEFERTTGLKIQPPAHLARG